jgi:type I restriction-modification system DNA methylase subunit
MANEELLQRNYLPRGKLKGGKFGGFEELNIGATSITELRTSGLSFSLASSIPFPFKEYKAPRSTGAAKPDRVLFDRRSGECKPVAVAEHKGPAKLRSEKELLKASEQGPFVAAAMGIRIVAVTEGVKYRYVDVEASLNTGVVVYFPETRDLNPAVLEALLAGGAAVAKNPHQLAQTVWQIIWHATKEEPKTCLLTFVELFVLKFLSDNLTPTHLSKALSFYELAQKPDDFLAKHGQTAINYYIQNVRPHIKKLFPDNVVAADPEVAKLFGLSTVVSKTSIINGFAFLRSSTEPIDSFNRTFLEILDAFMKFGALDAIDPEFKLRLYETFLKNTPRQQKLGQFFTPRAIVRQMIRMARLLTLQDDALVLDPAAGVGGFVLEPLLLPDALPSNVKVVSGKPLRRVRTVGVDVDESTHILAKANMLIHLAELVRDPATTMPALNAAMADTFVLMRSNEALGSLENPPRGAADVILTNPPYVTQGSAIYRKEIAEIKGDRNGLALKDYYEGWGLGVEALFMRYISGALTNLPRIYLTAQAPYPLRGPCQAYSWESSKPGGRAFVIVPLGMLNRTEPKPKERLLAECNVLASIELPRNTFFNTAQPTNILVIEKRHTEVDPRPNVLCGLVRMIGETLDVYRVPTPDANDLEEVATAFIALHASSGAGVNLPPTVKVVPAAEFDAGKRWDVRRLWTEEELVSLGIRSSAIERTEFIETATKDLTDLVAELNASKDEIAKLTASATKTVSLADRGLFKVRSGTRIRNEEIRNHPGHVPVYSCFTDKNAMKGRISRQFLEGRRIPIEDPGRPLVTVMANGAKAVGKVFTRQEECAITDDVIAVEVLSQDLDADYIAAELRRAIARGNFVYEAKLFIGRVLELAIDVP